MIADTVFMPLDYSNIKSHVAILAIFLSIMKSSILTEVSSCIYIVITMFFGFVIWPPFLQHHNSVPKMAK